MKIAPVDRYANWRATGSESRAAAASRLQPVTSASTAPAVPAALASGRELPVLAAKKGDNVQSRPVRSSDTPRGAEPALNLFRQFQSLAPVAMTAEPPVSRPDNVAATVSLQTAAPAMTNVMTPPAPARDVRPDMNGGGRQTMAANLLATGVANTAPGVVATAGANPRLVRPDDAVAASAANPAVSTPERAGNAPGTAAPAQILAPRVQMASAQTARPEVAQPAATDDSRIRPEDLLKQREAVANAGRITSQRFSDITQAQAQSTEAARQQAAEEAKNTPPKEPLTQLLMDQVRSLWEASRDVIDAASPPDKPGAPARSEAPAAGLAQEAAAAITVAAPASVPDPYPLASRTAAQPSTS